MAIETWLAFVLAAGIILMIPGPTILLVVSYALGQGRRAAVPTILGVALGDFVAMSLSLAGVGALLAASADLFTLLRWIGAAYLVFLGVKLWRAEVGRGELPDAGLRSDRAMFWHAFAVTALNPKSIVFFVAFVPQFLDPARSFLPQVAVLEATFVTLAVVNAAAYALLAVRARSAIARPSVQRLVNRIGGSLLIGAGAATASLRSAP